MESVGHVLFMVERCEDSRESMAVRASEGNGDEDDCMLTSPSSPVAPFLQAEGDDGGRRQEEQDNFKVTAPQNVVGIVGQDTILPCIVSSTKPLDTPEVQWKNLIDGHLENIYTYGQFGGEPVQKYRGRTSVPGDGFATGNVSLTLKNVQPADEGRYICIVESRDWMDESDTWLSIAGTGEVFIEILGSQGKGLELACRSHGWFPEPTVRWVTENEQELSADTETHQDSEKLFSVLSRITVTEEQVGKVTCQILNPLVQMTKKTTVCLSGLKWMEVNPC
ncbi:PREDICTED: butyrophilin-like protein 10 [Acanthisitta chloris]|uniref:butyrophilin-like protein 10 n=1 Tax=Acanthisitta chloris TaxID=57068 RepID=UPI0004F0E8F5|nr:PREDICTED: butyrophilin-like protein 10 [Acanthisitta chloris]